MLACGVSRRLFAVSSVAAPRLGVFYVHFLGLTPQAMDLSRLRRSRPRFPQSWTGRNQTLWISPFRTS